jgi:hypothetical protein
MLLFVRLSTLDRSRLLYPLMLVAIGAEDELLAAIGGAASALWAEAPFATLFTACGIVAPQAAKALKVISCAGSEPWERTEAQPWNS